MQTRLLNLLNDISCQRVPMSGLWLVHGDEPVVQDWLIEACRPIWSKNNQLIKRLELSSPKSWHEVLSELSCDDLFASQTALILTGKHKIDPKDKTLMAQLADFAQALKDGTSHHQLIWCLPKQDKKSLATKAIQFFNTHGLIIDANVYDEKTRRELLTFKACELGLNLDNPSWQTLMMATEKNLLGAYQTLQRLSFLSHSPTISPDELKQALVAGADFNVFDLSDALLMGNAPKILAILTHLRHTDTAPSLVLWAVAKELRLMLQLQAGKRADELGIWQSKIHLYTQSAHRTQHISGQWLSQIYATDQAIKGISDANAWGELERLSLMACGIDTKPPHL